VKRTIAGFLALFLLLLSGCEGWFSSSYRSVTPHVEQSYPTEDVAASLAPPVVTNRNELRGTVLSFIRDWTESGTILVEAYSGDVAADLQETMDYVTQEDPIGAYAVDYADSEFYGDRENGRIEISIVFRRSAAEIDSIVTVNGIAGANVKIRQALSDYESSLTLRIRNYAARDFASYIRQYCMDNPDAVLAIPAVSAEVYPKEGETCILELHLNYPKGRDEMRDMLASVNTILNSASSYIRSGADDYERATLLCRFLTTRFDYALLEEEPNMPAYSLLCEGQAHSLSFAIVFAAECKKAEIPCTIISGTLGDNAHYWNALELDGATYHLDLMRCLSQDVNSLELLTPEQLAALGYQWQDAPPQPAP
jgi:hypothetical protein